MNKDLAQAKLNIDMIAMLKAKSVNNLTADEEKIISSTLADLQLNYTDESSKSDQEPKKEEEETKK